MKKSIIVILALIYSFLGANVLFADTTPDAFTFTDRTNVAINTEFKSNAITVSGIDAPANISVTGGTYSINGAAYTSASSTVTVGNTVKVRKVSASTYSTTKSATLTIGGVSDTFSVTTMATPVDTTPDAFHFTDRTNVALSTEFKSNAITVSGINAAAPISITGGTYAINGGTYTSASGTVSLGNTVKVRKVSAGTNNTTKSATLTIGGVSDTFSVTTMAAPVANLTILVHGWNPDNSQPAWMTQMANAIIARSGGPGKIGTITVTGTKGSLTATCSDWTFDLATAASGEIVILVNWTAVANHLTTGITPGITAGILAQEVAAVVAPKIYQGQSGQPALSELPIHLIGHSRGGGMVFEIARLLGLQGIEVEQVTALDPHPLVASDPQSTLNTIDTPIQIYDNILFADDYYQNIKYPTGAYLTNAYNRLWTSLPGGYHNETGYTYTIGITSYDFSDHLNIILMYHGTINLSTPATNGQATMSTTERAWFNTFENAGENTGFKYSRIIVGNRKSTSVPVVSGDEIIYGYHNNALLGGSGARTAITWTTAVWPNVITSTALRSSVELQPGSQTLTAAEVLQINYKYRSYANASDVTFYVDTDRNPYNDNNQATIGSQHLSATGSTITQSTIDWTVSGLTAGTKYYVYAKITGVAGTRYLYLDNEFTVSP